MLRTSEITYAAPVFFYALPKYLKDELVRVEKRAMSIICPGLPYQETIELVNIVPIVDFIMGLCSNTFDTIIKDPEHRLNRLIQFSGPSRYSLRCNRRAMSIICPGLPYQETIELVNIVPIVDFIMGLCSNTFDTIIKDPEHRLNRLIQFSGPSRYSLRCNRRLIVPKCKTDRFRKSFIIRSCIDDVYT